MVERVTLAGAAGLRQIHNRSEPPDLTPAPRTTVLPRRPARLAGLAGLLLAAVCGFAPVGDALAREPDCLDEFAPAYPYAQALAVVRALPEWAEWQAQAGGRVVLSDAPTDMPRVNGHCAWRVEVHADRARRLELLAMLYVTVPSHEVFLLDPLSDEPVPLAQGPRPPAADDAVAAVRDWLLGEGASPGEYRVLVGHADLNDDGVAEMIALFRDPSYCGSGGCTLLVFGQSANTTRRIATITVADDPIHVSARKDHGWRALAVRAGSRNARLLRFDGHSYPGNASLAEPLAEAAGNVGETVALRETRITIH